MLRLPPATEQGLPAAPLGASPRQDPPEQTQPPLTLQPALGLPAPQTHLFSHLPLHSQQPSRTPYNMVPVGGIQVVPASLTYSTFVPIQAGPVQLTIPAVNVIHTTVGAPGDSNPKASGTTSGPGVPELSGMVPCIPIGQIQVPGLPNLSTPALQSLPSLNMETVNILGLANANLAPQVHPPGLALNAVGLQVVAANPSSPRSTPTMQTHAPPGLQILNIALPALIPSVSQVALDAPGAPDTPAAPSRAPPRVPPTQQTPRGASPKASGSRTASPQGSPPLQQENASRTAAPNPPAPARDHARPDGPSHRDTTTTGKAALVDSTTQAKPGAPSEPLHKARPEVFLEPRGQQTLSPKRRGPRGQPTTQFSDVSSDDDEDRLVIAT